MFSFFGWGSNSSSQPQSQTSPEKSQIQHQEASHHDESKRTTPSSRSNLPAPIASQTQAPPSTRSDNTNLKLFYGGIAFFALSVFVTRRASLKKRLACIPPYYSSSVYHQPSVNGAMEAFEALNLATLNVISFGMMATGGVMCALNVNGVEDMRKLMRSSLDDAAAGKSDDELEKDVVEWVSSVLGDRFEKQLEKEKAKKRTSGSSGENE
ncbi:hypothetical protein POX_g08883 [Penicillium oxalicum]|uniref:hypothetical protein n=1 Tax=Penicillium oxalicum TaxID=69781 RepID=UPI0020B7612E|nr:hypothetical protein POX_g08883 [Penicillium oxalicum]KAI2786497.1 hypothetical protein POX_g08883 [Penicillium oxalicum]